MRGQIYFGEFVKPEYTTIFGDLVKLVWIVSILKYHNCFCLAKTFDFSNKVGIIRNAKICDIIISRFQGRGVAFC